MIPVTKPYLPSAEMYQHYLNGIWQRQWLTNNGPLVNEFELMLKRDLQVDHLLFVGNGTIALQIAIKALALKGEIITTPFSYVATTTSILWEGCSPVFVDINKDTLNIDPAKIEGAITPATTAVLVTHCFGNACDIEAIEAIAKRHSLRVIYDAAHCYGTLYKGRSIFEYGDVSASSLHATKLMHSVEGGLLVTKDPDLLKRMAYLRNFGHDGPERFNGYGINGKNSEFHAAMGICVLKDFDIIFARRKEQHNYYSKILRNLRVRIPAIQKDCCYNFSYYPIIFDDEKAALKAKLQLEMNNIFPRRYFYPCLAQMDYVVSADVPIASRVASSILCLPLYHELSAVEQDMVARILLRSQNY